MTNITDQRTPFFTKIQVVFTGQVAERPYRSKINTQWIETNLEVKSGSDWTCCSNSYSAAGGRGCCDSSAAKPQKVSKWRVGE
ncbi:MAG: hypothetical protein IT327_01375 [Anaerolineae bacterium]|nr:hypothetical protein [Anaerolineae bacterium]